MVRTGAQPLVSLRATQSRDLKRAYPWYGKSRARLLLADAVLLAVAGAIHWAAFAAILSVFAVTALALAWRSRSTWGKARNWPPGSVGVGHDPIADPDYLLRSTRAYGAVFKANYGSEPMICIADLGLAARLYREHEAELAHVPAPFNRFVPGSMIRWSEGSAHADRRAEFSRALSPRFVRSSEEIMATTVRAELERMARKCAESGGAVAPRDHIRELVLATWSRLLFGIGDETEEFQEVRAIFSDLDVYQPRARTDAAVLSRLDRLQALIRSAAEQGGEGEGVSSMTREYARASPGALADLFTLRNLIFTAISTREDVAGLLMWVLKLLSDNPAWVARLREGPANDVDLSDRIVSETLRLEQSEYVLSRAKHDIRLDGFVIPAHWMIRVCVHEAHRDPKQFENPDHFNPDRFLANRYDREVFSPFGIGSRSCTGEILTRAMARVFIAELSRNFEWRVVSDGPRELSSHRHWAPSSRLAIDIRHRLPRPGGA